MGSSLLFNINSQAACTLSGRSLCALRISLVWRGYRQFDRVMKEHMYGVVSWNFAPSYSAWAPSRYQHLGSMAIHAADRQPYAFLRYAFCGNVPRGKVQPIRRHSEPTFLP